jgi:hypothetical protein
VPPETPEPQAPEPLPPPPVDLPDVEIKTPEAPEPISLPEQPEHPKISNIKAEKPPVEPPAENHHSFMGTTAQSTGAGTPFNAATAPPAWAAPYDLVPMDPMNDPSAMTSEFGSTPAASDPSANIGNFTQGHAVTAPPPTPMDSSVDSARNAVESAFTAAPPLPVPSVPVAGPNDTPVFNLPISDNPPQAAPPVYTPQQPRADAPAPPPIPPPLMAAPGAIIPPPPQNK